jgi:hypothetical protein
MNAAPYKDNKKVIHLNPEHLNVSARTRKRTPAAATQQPTAISPILRQKALLRRIKENKSQQLNNLTTWSPRTNGEAAAAGHGVSSLQGGHGRGAAAAADDEDDFAQSMTVLKTVAAIRASPEQERATYERKRQHAPGIAGNTAYNPYRLKNHQTFSPTMPNLNVDIHAPQNMNPAMSHFSTLDAVIPTYNVDTAVPYGVLRGGIKPTYRNWVKSAVPTPITASSPSPVNARLLAQRKIQLLREKYRAAAAAILSNPAAADAAGMGADVGAGDIDYVRPKISKSLSFDANPPSVFETVIADGGGGSGGGNAESIERPYLASRPPPPPPPPLQGNCDSAPIKKVIKRTFKRKYSLGRSKTAKSIGILIKNTTLRNNIIDAHKELRNHSIADVKRYLREHNLIKIGCDAPNDVLRSLYENAILTGDVVNINGGTLLHNFTNAKAGEHIVDGLEPIILESIFMDNDLESVTLN